MVSALLLFFLRKYGEKTRIRFATVNEAKLLSKSNFKTNYTVDLPKIGTSINIDHHKSNYENLLMTGIIDSDTTFKFLDGLRTGIAVNISPA